MAGEKSDGGQDDDDWTGKRDNSDWTNHKMKRRSKVDMAKGNTYNTQPHWSHFAVYGKRARPTLPS